MPLTSVRIDEIEALAQTILDDTFQGNKKLPIDIREVVKKQGLQIVVGAFDNSDIIGSYDRATKTIQISENENYQRTSFTIAHEIGHFLLHAHKDKEVFYRADANLQEQDKDEETEANWFAASLLMPKDQVKRFRMWLSTIDKLADIFGVSKIAMNYRLKNLRIY